MQGIAHRASRSHCHGETEVSETARQGSRLLYPCDRSCRSYIPLGIGSCYMKQTTNNDTEGIQKTRRDSCFVGAK
jgi:hypothetical protein